MQITLEEARALWRVARGDDGRAIVGMLKRRLAALDKQTRRMIGTELILENGKRVALEELIDEFEQAEGRLQRMQQKKSDRSAAI